MDLDELRSVQARERESDDLQELRESFYEDVGEYIARLKADREQLAAQVEDPFGSDEISQITDEIETAQEVVSAIYDRRVGKVIEQASLAAADYAVDTSGLTAEEEALFSDLAETISQNKATVLDVIEGDATDAAPDTQPTDTAPSTEPEQPALTDGAGTTVEATPPTGLDRTTVRITDDVGEILGVDDHTYDLAADDVVTLPEPNAVPLVERDAAEKLE